MLRSPQHFWPKNHLRFLFEDREDSIYVTNFFYDSSN